MKIDVQTVGQMLAQGNALASVLVPAVTQIFGLVMQLADQAKQRGWDIDTRKAEETAALFHSIAEIARAEREKYQGQ